MMVRLFNAVVTALTVIGILALSDPVIAQSRDTKVERHLISIPSITGSDWIEISGYSHEVTAPKSSGSSGVSSPFQIKFPFDSSLAPLLLRALLEGTELGGAVIQSSRLVGNRWENYVKFELQNVNILNYSVNGVGPEIPVESQKMPSLCLFEWGKITSTFSPSGLVLEEEWTNPQ
jgi:type VI protein secretion system component Hcp